MDSEKTTLSDNHSEHESEFVEVLADLREAVFRHRPSDVYQFCATYFNQKLAEQREGLLTLVKMNPSILDSSDPASATVSGAANSSSAGGSREGGASNSVAAASTSASTQQQQHQQQPTEQPRETGPEANDSQDDPHMRMRQSSAHAWSENGHEAVSQIINPAFSFGAKHEDSNDDEMKVDEVDEEARDKFTRLVSVPPASGVVPFAGRRFSVSAESMNPTTEPEYEKKFVPKTETQKQRIRSALDNNFLFKNLDEDSYRDVIDAMEEKKVESGQDVIIQGGVGDYFYIVEDGSFDIFVKKGADAPAKVATVENSGSFGELALMYNAPRAATVHATSDATLWALDRITFRRLLMERTSRKRRLYERFLETVPLLKSLESYERQKIADALESVTYNDGDVIVRQGDEGNDFFLIEQGTIRVIKADPDGVEREYPSLNQGGYFGELALLDNQPRQATLVANGRTKCARMSKDAFDRLLGPVINIIRREAGNYMHIQSLAQA
ncbi:camp-dependent protein kinase regulatory subunit [Martensiomyces pterosporus]|nr:camp-dependent protein kinase regulatory subunit [Martensiomyces pterosporus]